MKNTDLDDEPLKARLDFIIAERERGKPYEGIGKSLPKNGHGPAISKVRVMTIIRVNRPDLMGPVSHLQEWRKKQ